MAALEKIIDEARRQRARLIARAAAGALKKAESIEERVQAGAERVLKLREAISELRDKAESEPARGK